MAFGIARILEPVRLQISVVMAFSLRARPAHRPGEDGRGGDCCSVTAPFPGVAV